MLNIFILSIYFSKIYLLDHIFFKIILFFKLSCIILIISSIEDSIITIPIEVYSVKRNFYKGKSLYKNSSYNIIIINI